MKRTLLVALAALVASPLLTLSAPVRAETQESTMRARMGDTKDRARFFKLVDDAASVYSSMVKGTHGAVPASVLSNARCIAILPGVISGGLVVGGTHGEGLAMCKNSDRTWSNPAAVSISQGSIGLQAGAKSADLVFFFQNSEAVEALRRGRFALGSDVSAVAGNFDGSVDTSSAGVITYAKSQGLFAGAAVTAGTMTKDDDALASYYGKPVDYTGLLEGRETPDTARYSEKLTKMLPS
jgi:lipid-binding SYLF domain-containing protein